MLRSSFVGPFCLVSFLLSEDARACSIAAPDREALVDVGLSSIREALRVGVWDREGGDPYCQASLDLELSTLPSRSIVPRPREIASELAAAARAYGAKECEITVWVTDDTNTDYSDDEDQCYRGEYRFDGASWWAIAGDEPCW
jgi:hypothetical protein